MNMRELYVKREQELKEWTRLSNFLMEQKLSFEKARALLELEDLHYKKWMFYSNLCKTMGGDKRENNETCKTR